ncbi:MAG: ATP-binding cassette domain-containing protein [Actinobacteria bacterium]|nr:ATP-binding cassette domain-containing protein [Actinomycetota bacterium]
MDEVIRINKLTKVFNGLVAVNNVSFVINEGKIFGLLGPNGAGKTTTIRMLTGIIEPTSGDIEIFGLNIKKHLLEIKEKIGVLPELANPYMDLSAWENIMIMADLYNLDKKVKISRANEYLELFGLSEFRQKKVKGFSKGMKQRLQIIMALIHEPRLLFLDEPTTGLDIQSVKLIRDIIKEKNVKEKTTIFLTTHNIAEASVLCDRVAIMDKGKILICDSPINLQKIFTSTQSLEIMFDTSSKDISFIPEYLSSRVEAKELISGIEISKDRDAIKIYTFDPVSLIAPVLEFSKANGLKISSVNTYGPSLEEVFLKIINEGG